jgi:hypothetical protein
MSLAVWSKFLPVAPTSELMASHITSVDLAEVTDSALELSDYTVKIILERHNETITRLQHKWFIPGGESNQICTWIDFEHDG